MSINRGGSVGEGEADFPVSMKPDTELHPRTWDQDLSGNQMLN